MNIRQAMKMAFKSILGNKGRSFLTMLGIIIGIASVMTIVSTINGMNKRSLEQMEAMGTNRITVSAYLYNGQNAFEELYDDHTSSLCGKAQPLAYSQSCLSFPVPTINLCYFSFHDFSSYC